MSGTYRFSLLIVALVSTSLFVSIEALGQSVCVITEVEIAEVKGRVRHMGKDVPVTNARLVLKTKNNRSEIVMELTADGQGKFAFGAVEQGKYVLIVEGASQEDELQKLFIPLSVSSGHENRSLVITLGGLIGPPCGGGEVELEKAKCEGTEVANAQHL